MKAYRCYNFFPRGGDGCLAENVLAYDTDTVEQALCRKYGVKQLYKPPLRYEEIDPNSVRAESLTVGEFLILASYIIENLTNGQAQIKE